MNAASRLSRAGCRVTLLERESRLMQETSSRSTECFRLAWADPSMRAFVGRSIALLDEDAATHGVRLEKRGYVFLSGDEDHQRRLAASFSDEHSPLREHNKDLSQYDPASFSGVDLILGSDLISKAFPVAGSALSKGRDLHAVHMRRGGWFDTAQLAARLAEGLDVRLNSGVEELVTVGNRVMGVRLRSGEAIESDAVVLAMGPSFPLFARSRGLLPQSNVPFHNEIHAHCIFRNESLPETLPLTFFGHAPGRLPWSDEQRRDIALLSSRDDREVLLHEGLPQGLHFRKLPNNLLDSIWTWDRALDSEPHNFTPHVPLWYGAASIGCLAAYLPDHFGKAAREVSFKDGRILVPSLQRVIAGNYTMTHENRPVVGPLKQEGLFALAAFSGFGIMSAPAAGELITQHILGRPLPSYAKAFLLSRYEDAAYRDSMHAIISGKL